jgi:hypothetical protein
VAFGSSVRMLIFQLELFAPLCRSHRFQFRLATYIHMYLIEIGVHSLITPISMMYVPMEHNGNSEEKILVSRENCSQAVCSNLNCLYRCIHVSFISTTCLIRLHTSVQMFLLKSDKLLANRKWRIPPPFIRC